MGILSRFFQVLSTNKKSSEIDIKKTDESIKNQIESLNSDLVKIKKELASAVIEDKNASILLVKCKNEIKSLEQYAIKAVQGGNDNDASQFLAQKYTEESKLKKLQETYDIAHKNLELMQKLHNQIVFKINELRAKNETLKDKAVVSEMLKKLNEDSTIGSSQTLNQMNELNQDIEFNLDKENAIYSVDESMLDADNVVSQELQAIKAKLNK